MNSIYISLILLITGCCFNVSAQSWSAVGTSIEGTETSHYLARCVDISDDGFVSIIGESGYDTTGGLSVGRARVFQWDGTDWTQMGAPLYSSLYPIQYYGWTVEISGDASTVCASSYDATMETGWAQVYYWDGTNWMPKGAPFEGENWDDQLGYSMELSGDGNTLAIGERQYNGLSGGDCGRLRVYDWDGVMWVQRGNDIEGPAGSMFATGVRMSSDGLRVAGSGSSSNAIYFYEWDGWDWTPFMDTLHGGVASISDQFNLSESFEDVITGYLYTDSLANNGGEAVNFHWNGAVWEHRGDFMLGNQSTHYVGCAHDISADGNRIAVGMKGHNDVATGVGAIAVYDWNGTDWDLVADTIKGSNNNERLGTSVKLTPDGSMMLVGSTGSTNFLGGGTATWYRLCGDSTSSNIESCGTYYSEGIAYDSSGIYAEAILDTFGCVSYNTLNLTITQMDTAVFVSGGSLEGIQTVGSFQWLDCDNLYSIVPGATSNTFTPANSNYYALEITNGSCVDTSSCYNISASMVDENEVVLEIYPNPSNTEFVLNFKESLDGELMLYDVTGKMVMSRKLIQASSVRVHHQLTTGIYQLVVSREGELYSTKIMVSK